jgi:T3SS negative regulator,GrlR
MIDGFWIVQVEAVQGSGGGVAVLTRGHIFGGDNGFYYTGKYETDGTSLKARVNIRRFLPVVNIFGVEGDYDLNLTGTVNGDVIDGKATVVGQPEAGLVVRLTKKGNLP